jgi:hypothetical protein
MTTEEFAVACATVEDGRRIIAAAKVQRWDVVKWTVGINVGLAAAAALFDRAPDRIFLFSCIVAAIGLFLLIHYFVRLTNARNDALKTDRYLVDNGIDLAAMMGKSLQTTDFNIWYDRQELILFPLAILASTIPAAALVWRF